jgi:HEAT repeat protein
MRKQYSIISILCLLTLSMPVWALTSARLDELLSELKSEDEKRISLAAIKLAEHGPQAKDAVPVLIEMIRQNELMLYAGLLLRYVTSDNSVEDILQLTKDPNHSVQSCAMECLKQFDLDKDRAISIYTALLDHENPFVAIDAVDELCRIGAGELCLDVVIRLAEHEDPFIKTIAVSLIEDIGIAAPRIKQVLLDCFSMPDKSEVVKAAAIYHNLYPDEKLGLEKISDILKDQDRIIRSRAAKAIGKVKDVDEKSFQLVKKLMHDEDKWVSLNACYAVIRHHRESERAWRVINKSLESDDFMELLAAIMVLKELGPAARHYQEQLIKLIGNEDEGVQLVAIAVLGEIQPSKERVLPLLENKLKMTNDFFIWNATKRTIRKIQTTSDKEPL